MTREEAISRIKAWGLDPDDMEVLSAVIPELAENEDEKIRKYIIHFVKINKGINLPPDDADRMLAYLERQKEQKPIFKKGDRVIWDGEEFNILDVDKDTYNVGGYIVPFSREGELHPIGQKPAEWSDDIIRKAVKEVGLTQHQTDWFKTNVFPPKQEWGEEDERIRQSIIKDIEFERNFTSGTTSKADKVIGKYNEQINLLKSLPERFNLQPKQEWSEKDDEIRKALIAFLEMNIGYFSCNGFTKYDIIQWLKSPNPQPKQKWNKEDEEMFELLHTCVCRCINDDRLDYAEREQISKKIIPFIENLKNG